MKMIEVVSMLRSQGHQVDIYIRKDGGILVKGIDGQRFPRGAAGNTAARRMAGASLSEARGAQLRYATRARKLRKPSLDDEVKAEWRRVKKKWNKAFHSQKGKPHPAGYFGWNRINRAIKEYGREEALRRIKEAEKYASGLAYSKNVEQLAGFIMDAANKYNSDALRALSSDLIENAYMIRDEWIYPAYERLYDLNKGQEPAQIAKDVRKILRLGDARKNP